MYIHMLEFHNYHIQLNSIYFTIYVKKIICYIIYKII